MIDPQQHDFASMAGHEAAKQYLVAAFQKQALPHALLIHGPGGIGKLSLAYSIAKFANCPRGSQGTCSCEYCRKISDGVFADLLVVEPKGAAGQITLAGWKPGKDDPDGMQYYRFVDSPPLEGSRKVVIIRQAERMNTALANYLLKLIEEPPSYLLMLLLTRRRNEVLTTIRSRCAPLRLNPLSQAEMRGIITKHVPSSQQEEAGRILPQAEGRPGLLLNMLDDSAGALRAEIARLLLLFQQHGFLSLFRVASELQAQGSKKRAGAGDLEYILNSLQAWIRDAMIVKSAGRETAARCIINADRMKELETYAAQTTLDGLQKAGEIVQEAMSYGPRLTDKSYVLESALLKIGKAMR